MVYESVTLSDVLGEDVIQNLERGEPVFEHSHIVALLDKVHWDDLSILRSVAEHASFRLAARHLSFSLNTVRSRISRLEATLQTTIFRRDRYGLHITENGRAVLQVADEMRRLSKQLPIGPGNGALVKDGEIRICASEGLAAFWLTQRLPLLQERLPGLIVTLDTCHGKGISSSDLHDIVIGYAPPTDQEAIVSKVGTVHMMPFASEDYLKVNGEPLNFEDVVGHKCVQQDSPGLNYDALKLFLGEEKMRQVVSMKVGSSYSLFSAVAAGIGIGALPTYIRAVSKRVTPISLPIHLKFDVWMSFNKFARDSQPTRQAIDWVRECFDSARYPWFRDKFVHPSQFEELIRDYQIVPSLDHLIDDGRS
jgi:DNA-binding transcriptional LysR family regulator